MDASRLLFRFFTLLCYNTVIIIIIIAINNNNIIIYIYEFIPDNIPTVAKNHSANHRCHLRQTQAYCCHDGILFTAAQNIRFQNWDAHKENLYDYMKSVYVYHASAQRPLSFGFATTHAVIIHIYFHTYIIWVQNNNNNNHREIIILLFTLYVCDCTTNTIPIVPSFSVHEYNDLFIIISSPVHSSHKYDFIDFILWFYSHDMTLFFVVFSSSTIFLRIKKWRLFSMSKIRTDLFRKTISQIIFRKLFIFVDMKNHCWLCMKRKRAHSSAPKYFYVRIIITNFVHCARELEMPFNYRWNVCFDLIDSAQTWITFIYIYSFIDV